MSEKPIFHTTVAERKKFMELQWSLQQDIEKLLLKYEGKGTFSFTPFCDFWKEMKFGLIYAGKYRTQDFGHYTEMVYYTVKKYFMYSTSLYIQVGALYLLYALYYRNPFLHLIKIRVLKNEFEKLLEIKSVMQTRGELEFLYIFNKMLVDNVFDFVRGQYTLGLETRFLMSDLTLTDNIFRNESNIKQQIENETENAMCFINKKDVEYRKLLKQYTDENNIKIAAEPFNLKAELDKILRESKEPDPCNTEPMPTSSIGSDRRELRNKSFMSRAKEKRPAYLDNFETSTNSQ